MTSPALLRFFVPAVALALATASSALAETADTIHKSFDVAPGGKLTVDVNSGSIAVKTGTGSTVTVEVVRKFRSSSEEKERQMLERHEVKIEQSGNDVSITSRGQDEGKSFWNWLGRGSRRDIRYVITVPDSYHADLKTSGGPINVSGLNGTLVAHTSGGPLSFDHIKGNISGGTSGGPIHLERCVGDVDLHTSGGPIEVKHCEGTYKVGSSGGGISLAGHRGRVKAHTSGGGVSVDGIDGQLDASTSGGPVSASFRSQPTGDCRLHTSGGGVSVQIPANARFVLDAHTSGGGVHCDLPGGTDVEKSRGSYRATFNGGGPRIELSSSGGGISIDPIRGVEG